MLRRELSITASLAAAVCFGVLSIVAGRGGAAAVGAAAPAIAGAAPQQPLASGPPKSIADPAATTRPGDAALTGRGRSLFYAKGCASCHVEFSIGPRLAGLAERAATRRPGLDAPAYVRESILDPSAFVAAAGSSPMPKLAVSAAELDALVAYLLTL